MMCALFGGTHHGMLLQLSSKWLLLIPKVLPVCVCKRWLVEPLTQASANGIWGATGTQRSLSELSWCGRVACGPARKAKEESSLFNRRHLGDMENPETGVMDTQRETTNVGNVKRAAAASVREAQFPSTASTACCSCRPAQCRCSVCAKLC